MTRRIDLTSNTSMWIEENKILMRNGRGITSVDLESVQDIHCRGRIRIPTNFA